MKTPVSAAAAANSSSVSNTVQIIPKTEPVGEEGVVAAPMSLDFQTPGLSTSTPNKRPGFLDLNSKGAKNKRIIAPLVINSPDLQAKTLNTPDLEIILANNLIQTPQPGKVFPTKVGPVTVEQEAFGKGFEEALQNLHTNSQAFPAGSQAAAAAAAAAAAVAAVGSTATAVNNGISGGTFTYANEGNGSFIIKDEPQNPVGSPTVSPIDMETQEKIKLERKRQRNRVAASKCRKRKLERISKLEDRVKILKGENIDLAGIVKNLKDHVAQLKQQVMEHIAAGCTPLELSAGEELDDDDDGGEEDEEEEDGEAALDNDNPTNRQLLEQSMPLELFLSAATTSALELETSGGSPELSLNGSDLLEEEDNENDQPLVLYILSDDGT
ncbi:hypothetical protein KR059_005694 [Drosophila kikkawai]|nr:hypothetical protein KR059_005694 [Drosophila kikkawai]